MLVENNAAARQSISTQLDAVSNELLELTKLYANNEELVQAFLSEDRSQLDREVQEVYLRLESEHGLDVFEFGDANGVVFYRGHNPEKYGDDKSDKHAIQAALNGEELSGFEFGSSGLAVRAFVPIKNGNETVGTLQTGLSSDFIYSITESLHDINLNIANSDGEILVSSVEQNIATSMANTDMISEVLKGNEVSEKDDSNLESYIPLFDPTNTEVIGIINISQDISIVTKSQNTIISLLLIVAVATIIIVALVAWIFSRSFSKPIQEVTGIMNEISSGNLNVSLSKQTRQDEIGQLYSSVSDTQTNIRRMISSVTEMADEVKEQSSLMRTSSDEIMQGSQQVAITMQELSNGAESQASNALDLANTMNGFAVKIGNTNESSKELANLANGVASLTSDGKELMNSSINQMNTINQIVDQAVEQVVSLDKRTGEINNLVEVIQDIAAQTNLLALNAAIEAARAGESGRGFAVVADEVRKLAEQVANSIVDIKQIVEGIKDESHLVVTALENGYSQVEIGTTHINSTGKTFDEITTAISNMIAKINVTTADFEIIKNDSNQIGVFIDNIASISEEAAAGIEQTSASVQQTTSSIELIAQNSDRLDHLLEKLQELTRQFKL